MELQKHKIQFVVPPLSDIVHVIVNLINGVNHALIRVSPAHMATLHKTIKEGVPCYFSLEENKVTVWPRPDQDYKLTVRYLPPEKEL